MLDNTPNQPTNFRTKNWVEINDDSRGTYNTNSQIKFKISLLNSRLCDYSDAYILVKETITVPNTAAEDANANNANKKVISKSFIPFTDCISQINNTQVDNGVVMSMYNLIEHSNNYSKTSGILWKYCRDEPAVIGNGAIVELNEANDTKLFNFKAKKK